MENNHPTNGSAIIYARNHLSEEKTKLVAIGFLTDRLSFVCPGVPMAHWPIGSMGPRVFTMKAFADKLRCIIHYGFRWKLNRWRVPHLDWALNLTWWLFFTALAEVKMLWSLKSRACPLSRNNIGSSNHRLIPVSKLNGSEKANQHLHIAQAEVFILPFTHLWVFTYAIYIYNQQGAYEAHGKLWSG